MTHRCALCGGGFYNLDDLTRHHQRGCIDWAEFLERVRAR